jgi:hypothetical protein
MTTKHELGLMMAALFSAFGREMTELDVQSWHMVLGDLPRDEVTGAIWQACRAFEQMPAASKIRRLVLDRRVSATKNMTTATQHSLRIASAVKEYRRANPGCTADDVADYVSRLEQGLSSVRR